MFLFSLIFLSFSKRPLFSSRVEITSNQTVDSVTRINVENQDQNGGAYFADARKFPGEVGYVNFQRCTFEHCNNGYIFSLFDYYSGGAIYLANLDSTEITACTFNDCNSTYYGGAIAMSNVGSATFSDTSFTFCNSVCYTVVIETHVEGGALYFVDNKGCQLKLERCRFIGNRASSGAAMFLEANLDELYIDQCEFSNNSAATYEGGAICAGERKVLLPSIKSVVLQNSVFNYNTIGHNYKGSAAFIRAIDMKIDNCSFTGHHGMMNNDCPVLYISLYREPGKNEEEIVFSLSNCKFVNNTGSCLDFVSELADVLKVDGCSFINNTFIDTSAITGSPYITKNFVVNNCYFFGNIIGEVYHISVASGNCIYVPSGTTRNTKISNTIFDASGVKDGGSSLLVESYTEITNVTFKNHHKSTLAFEAKKCSVLINSITFADNSVTDSLAGVNGFLCHDSNITFYHADIQKQMIIKIANYVTFDQCSITDEGIDITANNVILSGTKLDQVSTSGKIFISGHSVELNSVFANDYLGDYIEIYGFNSSSSISIENSSFVSAPVFINNGIFVMDNSDFYECRGLNAGGSLRLIVDNAYISNCRFNESKSLAGNGGALYAKVTNNFTLAKSSFNDNEAAYNGSSLYLHTGVYSLIDTCDFHNTKSSAPSIFLTDTKYSSQTVLVQGCFADSNDINSNGRISHIYSTSQGDVFFNVPMCFDRSKEESVFFLNGQDADRGYNCYNCHDCNHMPYPLPTPTPLPTMTPKPESPTNVPPTISPTSTSDSDSDSDSHKLSTGAIVGIVLGALAGVALIIVGIVWYFRAHKRSELNTHPLLTDDKTVNFQTMQEEE